MFQDKPDVNPAANSALYHYSRDPYLELKNRDVRLDLNDKPTGAFWISDDDGGRGWLAYCHGERTEIAPYRYPVEIVEDAPILWIRSVIEFDVFNRQYSEAPEFFKRAAVKVAQELGYGPIAPQRHIRWDRVAGDYPGGVVITPYLYERRFSDTAPLDAFWYYGWDCASGALFRPADHVRLGPVEDTPPSPPDDYDEDDFD